MPRGWTVTNLEMRRISCLAAIIATRNGTEGLNFHIRNLMTAIVEVSDNRLVCIVACDRATVLAKPSPETSSSFSNVKHATSTA